MKNNISDILDIIDEYNLGSVVRYSLKFNMSQAAPYHNCDHMFDVMYNAYHAYKFYEPKQDHLLIKPMLVAALFHDFNHGQAFYHNDIDNTCLAIQAFNAWSVPFPSDDREEPYDTFILRVVDFINDLTFPHRPLIEQDDLVDYNIAVNCLRDADLFQYCMTTISSTVGIKQEYFKHWTWEHFLDKQIEFIENIQYHSVWGKKVAEKNKQKTVAHLKRLRRLCYTSQRLLPLPE